MLATTPTTRPADFAANRPAAARERQVDRPSFQRELDRSALPPVPAEDPPTIASEPPAEADVLTEAEGVAPVVGPVESSPQSQAPVASAMLAMTTAGEATPAVDVANAPAALANGEMIAPVSLSAATTPNDVNASQPTMVASPTAESAAPPQAQPAVASGGNQTAAPIANTPAPAANAMTVEGGNLPQQANVAAEVPPTPVVANAPASAAQDAAVSPETNEPAVANRPLANIAAQSAEAASPASAQVVAKAPASHAAPVEAAPVQAVSIGPVESAPQPAAQPASTVQASAVAVQEDANVEEVAKAVRVVSHSPASGRTTMTVRLDPPSLGSVRVHVQVVDGQMTATLGTSSEVARQLVNGSLDQLRTSLERSGVTLDRVVVTRMAPAGESAGSNARDGDANQSGRQGDGQSAGRENLQQQQRDQQRREAMRRLWNQGGFSRAA